MKFKRFNKKTAVQLLVAFLLCVVCSMLVYFVRAAQWRDWTQVQGTVISVQRLRKTRRRVRVHYIYEVDGQTYEGEDSVYSENGPPEPGDACPVWFDPKAPGKSSCGRPSALFQAIAPFGIYVILLLSIWCTSRNRLAT